MEKLNELVEQAKFVADWHGSDWSSALCQDKDGKQAHEIICESRGEAVISTGSNSNEASWLCDYLELCSPENILAIAEAYSALKQRAEAAEADCARLDRESQNLSDQLGACDRERRAGKAKLVELEKQEPMAWVLKDSHRGTSHVERNKQVADLFSVFKGNEVTPLFTRAAPAISLAELEKRGSSDSCDLLKIYEQHTADKPLRFAAIIALSEIGIDMKDAKKMIDAVFRDSEMLWECLNQKNPASAINLAELVPDESDLADRHIAWLNTLQRPMFSDEDWEELKLYTWLAFRDSYRVHKDAILRNIEEAK